MSVDAEQNPDTAALVYLDHAAATPVLPGIAAAHAARCREHVANPHASTRWSECSRHAIARAQARLLAVLGIGESEADVIWTSGATEALNLACLGLLGPGAVGACAVEGTAHAALLEPCRQWRREGGGCLELPVTADGRLDPARMPDGAGNGALRLLGLCHVNNETGVIQDPVAVRRWMDRGNPDTVLVVDGAQSFAKLPIPWHAARLDLLALGGRKIGGPAGTGALVRRRGVPLKPLFFGGGQQGGLRPGTLDTVGILEFVEAAERLCAECSARAAAVGELNRQCRKGLRTLHPCPTVISPPDASPYILSVAFARFEGAVLVRALAERGVVVAAGSACRAEAGGISHVLHAMRVPEWLARGALRVSFGPASTPADVDALLKALAAVLAEY